METRVHQILFGPSRFLFWGMLVVLVVLNLFYKWSLATTYAPDLGGFERNVILGIQHIMLGKGLYSNPESSPFFIIQYMPLYYHLVAGLGLLLHIDPLEGHSVYQLTRTFNLVLVLGSCWLLFQSARQHFKIPVPIALPISLLALLWMEKFTISGRPDSLKVFLFQLLVYVLLSFPEKRKRFVFPLTCLLGLMAFATKQDGLVFLGILPLSLVFAGRWKETIIWGLVVSIGIGLLLVFCQMVLSPHFLANVAGGLQNGLSISWFVAAFGNYFGLKAVLFGLGLVLSMEFAFEQNHKLRVVAAAFFCSFFPALAFSLKFGSGPNYFLECTLISLLILGIWLKTSPFKNKFVVPQSAWLLALVVFGLLFLVPAIQWSTEVFFNQEDRLKSAYQQSKELAHSLRKRNAGKLPLVLANNDHQWEDNLSTLMPDMLVAGQRDVIVQIVNAKGKTDYRPFQHMVEGGGLSYIITDVGKKPDFLGSSFEKYTRKTEMNGFWIWEK